MPGVWGVVGRVAKISYPDKTSEEFKYNCCNLIKSVDRAGAVTKFVYNESHKKVMEISPNGERTKYKYDDRNRLVQVIHPNKTETSYEYDVYGNKTKVVNPDKSWVKYEYNAVNKKTKTQYSDNTYATFKYDEMNRLASVNGNHSQNMKYKFNDVGQTISITNHGLPFVLLGRETQYFYDSMGRRVKTLHPDGSRESIKYKGASREIQVKVSKGIATQFQYDFAGRLIATSRYPLESAKKATAPYQLQKLFDDNIVERRSYDAFGNLHEIRKPEDGEWRLVARYDYQPDGQLRSVVTPTSKTGAVKQSYVHSYDSDGIQLTTVYKKFIENPELAKLDYQEKYGISQLASKGGITSADKLGMRIRQYAQKAGRRLYEIDAFGNKKTFKYNDLGQLAEVMENDQKQTEYKYDEYGRLAETEDILDRVYKRVYGENGKLSEMILPDGAKSGFSYNQQGRLASRHGAGSYPLDFKYTPFGEIQSYTDSMGATTGFQYDESGNLKTRVWANGSTTNYSYRNGLLVSKQEGNRITGYKYDDRNRLIEIEISQGSQFSKTTMEYDKNNKMVKITETGAQGYSEVNFKYDEFGRVIEEKGPVGSIKFDYNPKGLLAEKTCSFKDSAEKPFATKYGYDDHDRVVKVESPAGTWTYTYDKQGRRASLAHDDKWKVNFEYDKAGRLLSKTFVSDKEKTLLCAYKYDKLNRRVKAKVSGVEWKYKYDKYNQLIAANGEGEDGKKYDYDYSYDPIGNRINYQDMSYAYNKLNQLVSVKSDASSSPLPYHYDDWGNLLKTPEWTYKYDLHNRLIEAKSAKVTVKYSYDPLGQRVKSTCGEKETKFLMKGMVEQARVVDDKDTFHTMGLDLKDTLNKTGGIGVYLASTSDKIKIDYLYDGNGNVSSTISQDYKVKGKIVYSPFGKVCSGKELVFGFSSKVIDKSELYYYGYRFYSSELDKWLMRDLIRENGGYNLYNFCRNNAVNSIDYLGNSNVTSTVISCSGLDITIPEEPICRIVVNASYDHYETITDGCWDTCIIYAFTSVDSDFENFVNSQLGGASTDEECDENCENCEEVGGASCDGAVTIVLTHDNGCKCKLYYDSMSVTLYGCTPKPPTQ